VALLVVLSWNHYQHLVQANKTLEEATSTQAQTIKSLQAEASITNDVLGALSELKDLRAKQDKVVLGKLNQLERNNVQIKNYLDQLMPPDLAGLYSTIARNKNSVSDTTGQVTGAAGKATSSSGSN